MPSMVRQKSPLMLLLLITTALAYSASDATVDLPMPKQASAHGDASELGEWPLPESFARQLGGNSQEPYFAASTHRAAHRKARTAAVDCVRCELHGQCFNGMCMCNEDPENGFWSGDHCDECAGGWAGPQCNIECQGGSCDQCSGHGICSQGITGDGSCECFADDVRGYWDGSDCNRCASKFFGLTCLLSCPGLSEGDGQECFGRGTCLADIDGTGRCICDDGWGSETGCFDCDGGHHGFDCGSECVGYTGTAPCSGHGRCFNGTTGNGTCVCDPGWGTADCSRSCPNACSGRGECLDGADRSAQCLCPGNWAPPDCSRCVPSKTGADCHLDCLTNAANGRICSDHGVCDYVGNEPLCDCVSGYTGTTCEDTCPGSPPCSGHGTCRRHDSNETFYCQCDRSPDQGFWAGDLCDRCDPLYENSWGCRSACPLSGGLICGGHGQCAEGSCICERNDPVTSRDFCGVACEQSSLYTNQQSPTCEGCACVYCPELRRWGESCMESCPGYGVDFDTGEVYACNRHGVCREGRGSTGVCECSGHFTGSACTLSCPINPETALPCGGEARGACNWTIDFATQEEVATCICHAQFAGTTCELSCPVVAGRVCNGQGTCLRENASCICFPGFTGRACNVPCACDEVNGRCNATACHDNLSTETCNECICTGNFTGNCDRCKSGNQGLRCEGICVNGVTVGTSCNCFMNFSTPSCTVMCPQAAATGFVCGGHGSCLWGAQSNGRCMCDPEWFGPACDVWCTRENCRVTLGLSHPQCSPTSGECECQNDNNGRWNWGPNGVCDVCRTGSWGPSCTERCECSDNGACDQNTGACECYSDSVRGHWSGTNCEACAPGFVGERCERVEVQITRIPRLVQDAASTAQSEVIRTAAIGVNADNLPMGSPQLFAGGKPLNVFDIRDQTTISVLNTTRSATALGCANDTGTVVHVTSTMTNTYLIVQSSLACDLPIRIFRASLSQSREWLISEFTSLRDYFNNTVQVFQVASQVDSGEHSVIPPQMVVMHVAQPRPDGTPMPQGWVVRVSLDSSDTILLRQLESDFVVHDIAISPFRDPGDEESGPRTQLIAVAGATISTRRWDVHIVTTDLQLFFPALSLRERVRCWPAGWDGSCNRLDCSCDFCRATSHVVLSDTRIYLAQVVERLNDNTRQTMVAMLQELHRLPAGAQVTAEVQGRCAVATASRNAFGVILTDAAGRDQFIDDCPEEPCAQAFFHVRTSLFNQFGLIPTAKAHDATSNILYLALRHQVTSNRAAVLTKFDLDPSSFGLYGELDLSSTVEAMVVHRQQRVLYAITKDPVAPVQTFLLYEVRQLIPDVADLRGGTNVTIRGSGFRPPPGHSVVCSFRDPGSEHPTLIVAHSHTFWEAVCSAPRQLLEAVTGTSSCEGQRLEVTIFSDKWFTSNARELKRVQRPVLDPIVHPDRGFKDTVQTVRVLGSGFVPSAHSRCKFFSSNPLASEVLFSSVTFISPTEVWCQQGLAQYASVPTSHVDVSLDGQLFSPDVPPKYEIVGDPVGITMQDAGVALRASQILNLTMQVWVIDSQQQRLESLDNISRPVYLLDRVIESPCFPIDFAWRREDDGYPWPPCRNLTINATHWFQLAWERQQREEARRNASSQQPGEAPASPPSSGESTAPPPSSQAPDTPEASDAAPGGPSPSVTITTPGGSGGSSVGEQEGGDGTSEGSAAAQSYEAYRLSLGGTATKRRGMSAAGADSPDVPQPNAPEMPDAFLKFTSPGKGYVRFDEFYFYAPRAGTAHVSFVGEGPSWSAQMTITVLPGDPHALRIFNLFDFEDERFFIVEQSPLRPIELIVIDSLANVVDISQLVNRAQVTMSSVIVRDSDPLTPVTDTTFSAGQPRREGSRIIFADVFLTHLHLRQYFLTFSSQGLRPVTTPAIRTANCATNEYKDNVLEGTDRWIGICVPCPSEGAQCDGTENITVLAGFWRSSGSRVDIYECRGGASVCPGSAAAAGAAPNGSECAEGHMGPMCTLCAPDFGRSGSSSCTRCDSKEKTIVYVVLIALAFFIVVIGWVTFTLTKAEVTDVSIIARTVVNHLQATGELGEFSTQWSPFLKRVFEIQGGASSFSFNGVQALDCMLKQTDSDYTAVFMGYMLLPVVALGLGLFTFAVVRILKMKPVITKALEEEVKRDIETFGPHARTAILLHRYPLYMVLITALCVTMFTLYQTLIAQATQVLQCRSIVEDFEEDANGALQPIIGSYMEADMSLSCDSDKYLSLQQAAWVFTAVYGIGIPLMFVSGYKLVNARIAKPELTKLMFTFLIGGYKEQFWFWQAIIMVRKLVLVCVIVFIAENRQLQSYCAVWVMSAALILQIWFNPNEKTEHNRVEALSLAIITVTLNLSLLYFWPDMPDAGHFFLTGFLVLITLGAMIMFAYYLYQPLKKDIQEVLGDVMVTLKSLRGGSKKDDAEDDRKRRQLNLAELYADMDDGIDEEEGAEGSRREIGVHLSNKPRFAHGGGGAFGRARWADSRTGGDFAGNDAALFTELDVALEEDAEPATTPRAPISDSGDARREFLAHRREEDMTPRAFDDVL